MKTNIILDMEGFALRLKELRSEKELSIADLSKATGIGVASICRWENNKADIKGSQLIILADFFNVSVDYLLGIEK